MSSLDTLPLHFLQPERRPFRSRMRQAQCGGKIRDHDHLTLFGPLQNIGKYVRVSIIRHLGEVGIDGSERRIAEDFGFEPLKRSQRHAVGHAGFYRFRLKQHRKTLVDRGPCFWISQQPSYRCFCRQILRLIWAICDNGGCNHRQRNGGDNCIVSHSPLSIMRRD